MPLSIGRSSRVGASSCWPRDRLLRRLDLGSVLRWWDDSWRLRRRAQSADCHGTSSIVATHSSAASGMRSARATPTICRCPPPNPRDAGLLNAWLSSIPPPSPWPPRKCGDERRDAIGKTGQKWRWYRQGAMQWSSPACSRLGADPSRTSREPDPASRERPQEGRRRASGDVQPRAPARHPGRRAQ